MKGELNRDRYCAGLNVENNGRFDYCTQRDEEIEIEICKGCRKFHHKWPTLEQFKEEYGEKYPSDATVYYKVSTGKVWICCENEGCALYDIGRYYPAQFERSDYWIVCACTPWGKPPNDWRPE